MNELPAAHRTTPSGKLRARAAGIPFDGEPGVNNAITDVPGIEVGYTTLIRSDGALETGKGPIRTGVTAILPRGRAQAVDPVFGGLHSLNGCGEVTGAHWIEESGQIEGPVLITNTLSAGVARDAASAWLARRFPGTLDTGGRLAVVGETNDGYLNDLVGQHVTAEHVFGALDAARDGAIEQGSVGGGTGMICYEYKGGSGTASRRVSVLGEAYVVGVFVQSNFGLRRELTIAGVPVGRHLPKATIRDRDDGSLIIVVATDAPLLPHQLKRLARRAGLGMARSGAISGNGSGDIFLALSTANPGLRARSGRAMCHARFLPLEPMDRLFRAVIEATDEAIVDSMVANEAMTGRDGHVVEAVPLARLRDVLEAHGRLAGP